MERLGSTDQVLAICSGSNHAEYNPTVGAWILVCDNASYYAIIPPSEYSRFNVPCNGGPAWYDFDTGRWICEGTPPPGGCTVASKPHCDAGYEAKCVNDSWQCVEIPQSGRCPGSSLDVTCGEDQIAKCVYDQTTGQWEWQCRPLVETFWSKLSKWLTATQPEDGALIRGLPNYVIVGGMAGTMLLLKKSK
jgi:hypothetical protein